MDLLEKLTAAPRKVAYAIARAVERKTGITYVHPIWRLTMLIIRNIPEFAFKKLKI